jgi:hypothetical protein
MDQREVLKEGMKESYGREVWTNGKVWKKGMEQTR